MTVSIKNIDVYNGDVICFLGGVSFFFEFYLYELYFINGLVKCSSILALILKLSV